MQQLRKRPLYCLMAAGSALLCYGMLMQFWQMALLPHVWLIRLIWGLDFTLIPEGYVSFGAQIVITPGCMGAKLFLCAYLMLALGFPGSFRRLPLLCGGCLLGTLFVSVVRIAISLPFAGLESGTLIHTLLSLFVYFGALTALYAVAQKRRGGEQNAV